MAGRPGAGRRGWRLVAGAAASQPGASQPGARGRTIMPDPAPSPGERFIARFRERMPLAGPVDDLIASTLLRADPALDAVLAANQAAGLVPHDVAPNQGRLLELLVRGARARRVLEIGTLGGYSTV